MWPGQRPVNRCISPGQRPLIEVAIPLKSKIFFFRQWAVRDVIIPSASVGVGGLSTKVLLVIHDSLHLGDILHGCRKYHNVSLRNPRPKCLLNVMKLLNVLQQSICCVTCSVCASVDVDRELSRCQVPWLQWCCRSTVAGLAVVGDAGG